VTFGQAKLVNVGTLRVMTSQKAQVKDLHEAESSDAFTRGRLTRSSDEGSVMVLERRSQLGVARTFQPKGMRW